MSPEKETFVTGDDDDKRQRGARQELPDIVPKFVFGLTTGVSGNCLYQNDHVIVFPAAGVIVIHDLESRAQRYISLTGTRKVITAMDLNSINNVLALATEDDEESPIMISIYDLRTLSLKYVFTEPDDDDADANDDNADAKDADADANAKDADAYSKDVDADANAKDADAYSKDVDADAYAKDVDANDDSTKSDQRRRSRGRRRFASVKFLQDNINIAALVSDGVDCVLYYYSWRNAKLDTSLYIDGPVADVALNPIDPTICCFVGKEFFRLMTRIETEWKQYGFREANGIVFTCVCWLDSDSCLAGTTDGRVVVIKNGVLQNSFHVHKSREMDLTFKTEKDYLSVISSTSEDGRPVEAVRICIAYQYGLVLVVGNADIYHFIKTDEGRRYVRNRIYQKREYWYFRSVKHNDDVPLHRVESACVSRNCESLTFMTRCGRLYWCPLDVMQNDDDDDEKLTSPVEINQLLVNDFHYGGVESLSTCLWKPLVMTCGKLDCSIKLWDYAKCTLILTKQYSDQVRSVSIHPTGLYSVVAFFDRVEFQKVQTEDLVPMEHFLKLNCSLVAFSSSGHMFAMAYQEKIDIYCSRMLDKHFSYQVHVGTIEMMTWSNNDMNIVAYNTLGAIFMFNTRTGKKMFDMAPCPGANCTGLAVSENVNRMYVINKDSILREVYDRKVVREVDFHQGSFNALSIAKSDSSLFIAAQNGVVLVVLLPIAVAVIQNEFKMHKNITKMCLTVDDSVLITCSEDGSMCMWEVKNYNKTLNIDNRIDIHSAQCDDALVNMSELEKMNEKILRTELVVSKLESDYLYTTDQMKKSKQQEIELKKISISQYFDFVEKHNIELAVEHYAVISKLQNDKTESKAKNEQALARLDAKYSVLLVNKYGKYLQLENITIARIEELKIDIDASKEKLDLEYQEAVRSYEATLNEKDEEMIKSKDKLIYTKKCLTKLVGDTEVDVDKYVSKVRHGLTTELKNMKQLLSNAMANQIKIKMDYEMYERSVNELKQIANTAEDDINDVLSMSTEKKNYRISNLSKMLLQYRDDVQRKDKEMMAVDGSERRLETQRSVCQASIEELERTAQQLILKNQKKKNLIEKQETVFNDMSEHEKRLALYYTRLTDAEKKAQHELNEKKKSLQDTVIAINKMKAELFEACKPYSSIRDKHRIVTEFFNKYLGEIIPEIEDDEYEARIEFFRQIGENIKSRIGQLEHMIKSISKTKESQQLLLKENMRLLGVIEVLRKEAKMYLTKYNNLKHFLPPNDSGKNK